VTPSKARDALDRDALRWAGFLGHAVAIVVDESPSDGDHRRVTAELSSIDRARTMVREEKSWPNAQIWARDVGGGPWKKRVTP
jgi:hypothetical protein